MQPILLYRLVMGIDQRFQVAFFIQLCGDGTCLQVIISRIIRRTNQRAPIFIDRKGVPVAGIAAQIARRDGLAGGFQPGCIRLIGNKKNYVIKL